MSGSTAPRSRKPTKEECIHEFMMVIGRYYAGKESAEEPATADTVSHIVDQRSSSPLVISPAQDV